MPRSAVAPQTANSPHLVPDSAADSLSETVPMAAIQMVTTPDLEKNFASAAHLVAEAAQGGAQLVLLPEYWPVMGKRDTDKLNYAEVWGEGPIQQHMADMARKNKIWLIGGTMPLSSQERDRVYNSTLIYGPDGVCHTRYDKIHLFSFQDGEEAFDEARTIVPGAEPTVFDSPFGRIGLTVCYDLRFPELYRAFGDCTLIVLPAAFTYTTGKAHWEVLLRARAIENQCYVLAAAQGGTHPTGRRTYGHSILIDPWGEVVALLKEGEGIVAGEIKRSVLQEVRRKLPALKHRKLI